MDPTGTIIFNAVGRPFYGFDIFSVLLSSTSQSHLTPQLEHRLTDGLSVNHNGSFSDNNQRLVFISERTGSANVFMLSRSPSSTEQDKHPKLISLPSAPRSQFHDRPLLRDGRLYFISAYEEPDAPFKSWTALYSAPVSNGDGDGSHEVTRLTPTGEADYSPAISHSGKFMAVASYGSKTWGGEFHELQTDIVVFSTAKPATRRFVVAEQGGWPTWSGDHTIFFHRRADDGWWSIYRVDFQLPVDQDGSSDFVTSTPKRVTPAGLHAFTPAAFQDGKRIAVATRRKGIGHRHIEVFDLESEKFEAVTELLNPSIHHYNPFVSADSSFLGYHRFRGVEAKSIVPNLEPVKSPISTLRMFKLNGMFPAFSPNGDFFAFIHNFEANKGLRIIRSDGIKRWTVIKERTAFCNAWSPVENGVIFTSLGPIFQSATTTVQVARVTFDSTKLVDGINESDELNVDIKILTREETGNNAFPSVSPDGKWVVFRSGRSGFKNLYILDAINGEVNDLGGEGDGIRRLTEGEWIDTMPSWSPDGKWIAFSSNRHNPANSEAFSIYLIRPDGSGLKRINVTGKDANRERINHVCFSRDCEWLLFTANIGGVTVDPVALPNQFQPYGDLFVVRVDGSGLKRLTFNGYENGTPTWYGGYIGGLDGPDTFDYTLLTEDVGRLALDAGHADCDPLEGKFDEPLWLTFDL